MTKSLKDLKKNGQTLRKHLEEAFAHPVTLSQAYEALAVAVGATSWNALSAQTLSSSQAAPANNVVATSAIGAVFGRLAAQNGGYFAAPAVASRPIRAVLATGDEKILVGFDASIWFREEAAEDDVSALMDELGAAPVPGIGEMFGQGSISDEIAQYCAKFNKELQDAFAQIDAASLSDTNFVGMHCSVSQDDVKAWLANSFGSIEQVRGRERTHNQSYDALVAELGVGAGERTVRDVDLAKPENRDLALKLCARIWADCIEEWKHTKACDYVIESSTIFKAMSAFPIEGTDDEGGYCDEAHTIVEELLMELGYFAQARRLFKGEATIYDPVVVDEVCSGEAPARAEGEYSAKGMFNTLAILEVNLVDVLNEYELPDATPEWQWVEQHHSFAHKGNGKEQGVWEYMVHVEKAMDNDETRASIPAPLRPFFDEAVKQKAAWIMFHQG